LPQWTCHRIHPAAAGTFNHDGRQHEQKQSGEAHDLQERAALQMLIPHRPARKELRREEPECQSNAFTDKPHRTQPNYGYKGRHGDQIDRQGNHDDAPYWH
jgi:hypothetical protein